MAEFTQSILDAIKGTSMGDPSPAPPRIIVSLAAPTGHGKTHWALGAPKPLAYFGLEAGGEEGVLVKEKFNLRGVRAAHYHFSLPNGVDAAKEQDVIPHAKQMWERFVLDYRTVLAVKGIRTVVIDTFSECYDLCKLARLGTTVPFPRETVGKVNTDLLELVRRGFRHDKNVILLQHLKDEWSANQSTGRQIPRGPKEVGEIAQANIRMVRNPDGTRTFTITKCRPNETLFGEQFTDMDFSTFASLAFPGHDPSVWED